MRDSTFASFFCAGRLTLLGLRTPGCALEPGEAAAALVRRPLRQRWATGHCPASRCRPRLRVGPRVGTQAGPGSTDGQTGGRLIEGAAAGDAPVRRAAGA